MLAGMPCSGKTSWVKDMRQKLRDKYNHAPVIVLSKDYFREKITDPASYRFTKENEDIVSKKYYDQLMRVLSVPNAVIVLDNTHSKPHHIPDYLRAFKSLMEADKLRFYIKTFNIPYSISYWRNMMRRWSTGKFIPTHALKAYHENFKSIDFKKYEEYFYEE